MAKRTFARMRKSGNKSAAVTPKLPSAIKKYRGNNSTKLVLNPQFARLAIKYPHLKMLPEYLVERITFTSTMMRKISKTMED